MGNLSTPRPSDWHETATAAANTVVVAEHAAQENARHYLTAIDASYDTANSSGTLELFGLSKVGPMDLTDTDVCDLTTNTFTVPGHGLVNGDKVVFHTMGGTAPTNLTSGNTYYVVGVSGADFQLAATSGGAAIDISGTQANLATEALVLPLSKAWEVYNALSIAYTSPLMGDQDTPLIAKLEAVTSVIGTVNLSGYSM